MMVTIIPAVLTKDLTNLKEKIHCLARWAPMIHLDIADGKFVPNITVSLAEASTVSTMLRRQWHLMLTDPLAELATISLPSNDQVLLHVEALAEHVIAPDRPIGLVVNPTTDLTVIRERLASASLIMLMGIEPGFQGQTFLLPTLQRLQQLRRWFPKKTLSVDGGVHAETIRSIITAGANQVIVGSSLWQNGQPEANYRQLCQLAESVS